MFYCPYTDKDLKEHEISREHIIPLSLGGIDGYEIFVSKKFNSANAAKIDATLANDFFILMQRNRLDIR
ncbi:HNH endonuclease [Acinetobacter gerneri]|uniref:HNH endonuclease n=1 Tax=Acinetobacter gerneri TaxID=202952 RepID=UPI00358ED28D